MRTQSGIRVKAAAALVAVAIVAPPAAARAQISLGGSPLDVSADGLGGLQVRVAGQAAGLFAPGGDPGHAGLEIREGATSYPLAGHPGRAAAGSPSVPLQSGVRRMSSRYTVGPHLEVTEVISYTDGTSQVDVHYDIANVSAGPVSFRAGELADLSVAGAGVFAGGAARFVGVRPAAGGPVHGLQEQTPWGFFAQGDARAVFANFEGGGLNNTVDPAAADDAVGAMWSFDAVAPGQSRAIDVRWLLGAPAPPGTGTGGALPPPVAGKTINVAVRRGTVRYRRPGASAFTVLKAPLQLPVGSTLDTLKGRVTLTTAADRGGTTQHAWFYSGIFKVSQTGGSRPITQLALADVAPSCASASAAASGKKRSRRLWGDGEGRFRTRGQFSAATVRGTKWVVIDRCDGTLTRVVRGTVAVRDFARGRTILLKAGRQYLARRPK